MNAAKENTIIKEDLELKQLQDIDIDFEGNIEGDLAYNKFLIPYAYIVDKLYLNIGGQRKLLKDWNTITLYGRIEFFKNRAVVKSKKDFILLRVLEIEVALRKLPNYKEETSQFIRPMANRLRELI